MRSGPPLKPSDAIAPRLRPSEPPQLAERRIVLTDERVSEPYVIRSYLATERNPGDQRKAAALTLLAEVLGGNPTTSVFARELQFGQAIATWSAAFYDGTSVDADTFGVYIMPVPGVPLAKAEAQATRLASSQFNAAQSAALTPPSPMTYRHANRWCTSSGSSAQALKPRQAPASPGTRPRTSPAGPARSAPWPPPARP